MSSTYIPFVLAIPSSIPAVDGVQTSPPVWWHAVASDINAESGSGVDGRYNEATGELESNGTPTLQDTYLSGTGSRSGRAFDAGAGTWKDDFVSPWSDKYGLLQPDSTLATWSITDHTANTSGLQNALVIIRLGVAPASNSSAHNASNCYAYFEIANGQTRNWRMAFRWGRPIALEHSADGGTNWYQVSVARKLGSVEHYLAHHNNEIRMHIRPDSVRGIMAVEIGDGHWLRHSVPRPAPPATPQSIGTWPTTENYKFSGAYRWASFEVYPLTYGTLTITKGPRYFTQDRLRNLGAATADGNFAGRRRSTQTSTLTTTPDGGGNLGYTLAATNSDTSQPSTFSDVLIYIPSQWENSYLGTILPEAVMTTVKYRELQVWDDACRMGMTSGRLTVNNARRYYDTAFGNFAVSISAGNGYAVQQRVRGVLGVDAQGVAITRHDPYRFAEFPVRDFWAKLEVPLNQEVILDGLCIYTAVRLLLDIGQVNPAVYAVNIPDTGRPPQGGYPDTFPYYILGSGTGLNPKYRFGPERSVLSVLQELIQDSGEVNNFTGRVVPHYMWFDAFGQFHFEAYDPGGLYMGMPKQFYFTYDPTGLGQIHHMTTYNSVSQMRTEVVLQGQDAFTYELMQWNIPLPGNLGAVGYQFRWLERNARYASPAYMDLIARIAVRQASLPTQIVRFQAPYWPHVFAGDVIGIPEIGQGLFTVLEIDSTVGHDEVYEGPHNTHCYSWITGRSLANAIA